MESKPIWVGLDVSADSLVACITDDDGAVLAQSSLANCADQVAKFVTFHQGPHALAVGLEAGSVSTLLTRKLRDAGLQVHAFETRQASRFLSIRRNKTDRNDARGIADMVRLGRGTVAEVRIKSIECQQLRSKLVLRQNLIRQRSIGEGALRGIFRLNGGRLVRTFSAAGMRSAVIEEVNRIKNVEGVDLSQDVLPFLDRCEATRRLLEVTNRQLEKLAAEHPICSRFMAIPGVGHITALSFFTAIEDPSRFERSEDVGAYLGLVPRVRQSGKSSYQVGISRMGSTMTRTHLTAAAMVLMRSKTADCALQDWGRSLAARMKAKKARAAVARKLAVVMIAMWKSGESFRPR